MQLKPGDIFGSSRIEIKSDKESEPGDRSLAKLINAGFYPGDNVLDTEYYIVQDENHKRSRLQMWNLVHYICRQEQASGGFPFHAGLIELSGKGALLAAPSGVGKSTCCLRIPPPWRALADDQTLVVCEDRERYYVHPLPTWSALTGGGHEPTWNVENFVSLSAIFFLQQAEQDEVQSLDRWQVSALVYKSARAASIIGDLILSKEERRLEKKRQFHNACDLARVVPGYSLKVSRQGEFWREIEKVF